MVIRIKIEWFLFILAQALRSWLCATLAFVRMLKLPEDPGRCSLALRLVDFVLKGQQEKKNHCTKKPRSHQ